MTVLSCSGRACTRAISVSRIPGGNPTALADPENWAIKFYVCTDCKNTYCDRCAKKSRTLRGPRCASCGGTLVDGEQLQEVWGRPAPEAVSEHERGQSLCDSGQFGEALVAFERAVQLRPGYVEAHFLRGLVLRELNRLEEAIAAFEEVIRLDPRHVQALFDRAIALRQVGRSEEALAAYDQTIGVDPRNAAAYINKSILLNDLGRAEEALAACDQALGLSDSGTAAMDFYAFGAKGAALIKLRRYGEALEAIDEAIDSGPDNYHNYHNKAFVLERLGRLEESAIAQQIADDVLRRERGEM